MQTTHSLPSSVQNLPIFVEYQLSKELVLFQKKCLPHVYISSSHGSAFEWFGVMFIHSGVYRGAIIRFMVKISPQYPNSEVPKIITYPIPKHPLVNAETGELNLSEKFDSWNSSNNFIFEVIQYAKQVFEIDSIEQLKAMVPNMQLIDGEMWTQEQIKQFNRKVIKMTHPDKHFINFNRPENLDDRSLNILKRRLLTSSDKATREEMQMGGSYNHRPYSSSTSLSGLSWTKKILFN